MPSFVGRLGKHSNRSSHALADPSSSSSTGTGASSGLGLGSSGSQRRAHPQLQQLQQQQDAASATTPHSALSSSSHNTTAFSSSESFDSRLLQQQQQQQQLQSSSQQLLHNAAAPPPPAHLYSSPSAASSSTSANPPQQLQHSLNPDGSPVFDGHPQHQHQYSQHPHDFADAAAVTRSSQQSNRYSTVVDPRSPYAVAGGSVDDLNTTTISYGPGSAPLPPQQQQQPPQPPTPQQQQQPPEKRSTRKLIKGIFSGSSRDSHHHSSSHAQQPSYDNTGGLARRPSKRVSNQPPPPSLKTSFSHLTQQSSSDHHSPIAQSQSPYLAHAQGQQDWPQQQQQQQQYPAPSPLQQLGEVEEYYEPNNTHSPSQSSRVSLGAANPNVNNGNTIRKVSGEVDPSSAYDETAYLQQQQQQPHVQIHPDDQQHYDYDQYSPQNPQSQQQQQYYPNPQQQQQQQAQYQPGGDPRILSHLGPSQQQQQQNAETVSQFSHESPITDVDQRSANPPSSSTSPAVKHSVYVQNQGQGSTPSLPPAQQQPPPTPQSQQQSGMAPPSGGPPSSRRNQDAADKALRGQVEPPAGPPPSYRHSQQVNTMNPLPPVPQQQGGGQQANYRGAPPPVFEGQTSSTTDRTNSPQPSTTAAEPADQEKQFKDLLTKYKNVKRLYFDGKSQIELLNGQVEQLQNAVANQRMSQSRTVFDDNEYSTRFNRLNGAINNLSFNIRKDWRSVPQWLEPYISTDALKTGKQEMTAIGRAVISRWLVEEVFNKCFHPGLEPQLSQQLKEIELNIRHNAYTMSSQEEHDALTQKVVTWRMTTLDGLNRQLNSPATADNRTSLIEKATGNLTACLFQYLNDPPPAGVQGSTSMIVELAIGIANNIPMESRDVAITYPLPGDMVQPHLMEVEKTPLPVLEAQRGDSDDEEEAEKDKSGKSRSDKPKPGTLRRRSVMSVDPQSRQASRQASIVSTKTGTSSTDMDTLSAIPKDANRVRFAGFIALEVRGRQVLMKAPVWTL